MKKLLFILAFTSAISLQAQDMIFSLSYSMAQGAGDFENFISKQSYRGGSLNYTRFLNRATHIGIGGSIDWQGFFEKTERSTFPHYSAGETESNTDINAVQFRYMYTLPITVGIDFYILKDKFILPYVGLNLGVQYTEQEMSISGFDTQINTAWDPAFGPEAGVHLAFGESGIGLNAIAKYNMSTYSHEFQNIKLNTDMGSYMSVAVGISFMMMRFE